MLGRVHLSCLYVSYDKLGAKQAELQEKIEAADGWNLDSRLELAMEALRVL